MNSLLKERQTKSKFLNIKNNLGALAVFFCFAMTSGQMYNHMHDPPFVYKAQNGETFYIHNSAQDQLIVETYIIMLLNAMIALGMVVLTETGTQINKSKGRIMVFVGLALVNICLSFLHSVVRLKTPYYPYRL